MSRKLHWVDVLNEQASWSSRASLTKWFSQLIGRSAVLFDGAIEGFEESLTYMRKQLFALHFHEELDLVWLDTQLVNVSLGLIHHQGAQAGAEGKLPLFRARVRGLQDSDLLRSVKETLLVQFAAFLAEVQESAFAVAAFRCEGLYKESGDQKFSSVPTIPPEQELRWRREIDLLVEHNLEAFGEIQRCNQFFLANPKARFCSDSCRFKTFQITKQLKEPGYLAEKQRRYRKSKASSEAVH